MVPEIFAQNVKNHLEGRKKHWSQDAQAQFLNVRKICFFAFENAICSQLVLTMRQVILRHFRLLLVIFWIRKWAICPGACFRMHLNPSSFELVDDEKCVHVCSEAFQNIITPSQLVLHYKMTSFHWWRGFVEAQWRGKSISRWFYTFK